MSEENNVNFSTIEKIDIDELEELIEDFPEEELCDCEVNLGFGGDYDDLLIFLYQAEERYINSKLEYEKHEVELWLNTDFEEVMDNPKPTLKEKEMYVKKCLLTLKLIRDMNKANYDHLKRMYDLSLKYTIEVLR